MSYQNQPQYGPPAPKNPGMGLGIASMVLGIVGLCTGWIYVGVLLAIVGLVLGVISKKKSDEVGMPSGMAMAGIVCSIIGLAVAIICTACSICIICSATGGMLSNPYYWM